MKTTETILGPQAEWPAAELHLDSVHPFWGGHTLALRGDGALEVAIYAPGGVFTHARQFQLSPAEVTALFASLAADDIFGVPLPLPEQLLPDTAANTVRLQSGSQQAQLTFFDHHPLPPALDRLHKQLLEFVARAR